MSFSQNIPRDPYTSLIRSRYPQIHSNKCKCTTQPSIKAQIQALKTQNILLRSRMTQGLDKGERQMSEDRVRFMELENRKLHDKIIQYQKMMEELEKTHLELVNVVRAEQQERMHMHQSARNPGSINQGGSNTGKNYHSVDPESSKIEGDYLISLKKIRRNDRGESRSPDDNYEYSMNLESTQKRGLKNSFIGTSEKKQYHSNRMNPENQLNYSSYRTHNQQSDLKRALQKIRNLESQLEQKNKMKTENRIVLNENQNLKNKLKNIEENIKSYEESIKHYQSEINRLKILIEELKSKEVSETVTNKQNDSLKNSNDYLKEQIAELELELEREKENNQKFVQQIQNQKRVNSGLRQECEELNVFARQSQKQKKTINLLNQQLEKKSHQLLSEQTKAKKYQNILKQVLEIRQMVEKVDLNQIQNEEKKIVHQHKSKHALLNNQVSVLTSQLERFKQQILILEQKIAELTAAKQLLTSSLQESNKENLALINQIRSLEDSIERFLQQQHLPTLRVSTLTDQVRRSGHSYLHSSQLKATKQSLAEVIDRLQNLQNRMQKAI